MKFSKQGKITALIIIMAYLLLYVDQSNRRHFRQLSAHHSKMHIEQLVEKDLAYERMNIVKTKSEADRLKLEAEAHARMAEHFEMLKKSNEYYSLHPWSAIFSKSYWSFDF